MKKKTTLILIGLLLILAPYFLNSYGIYRLFSLLIGLTVILIALIKDKEDKLWRIVIFPIVFLILSFGLDFAIVHIFNRIPVYSTKEVSSKNVINYNSLFYRVYSCNKKLTIDNFYKKDYLCSDKELDKLDSSSFLNNVIENYIEYKNKFVKIEGKVSKINGTYNLEMQAFTLADDSINGNVLFSDNVTLEVNFNKILDLTPYKVYDSIIVIGRIDELVKKGSNYIVKMDDSKILESDLYNEFELSVIEKNNCENDKTEYAQTPELTYYTSCLDKIFVKYDDANVYDLSYVLIDKKITLETLVKESKELLEENGNILYEYDTFKVLACANKKEIILGDKSLKIDSPYCEAVEPNTSEEL